MIKTLYLIFTGIILLSAGLHGQNLHPTNEVHISPDFLKESGPRDYDPEYAAQLMKALGPGWGYNYDSLLADLGRWSNHPFITIDSIGASVQNRALWSLTISDTSELTKPVFRLAIHARTHPQEVESSRVTNEMIGMLTGEEEVGRILRKHCIINIIPMYNPDGVELGYPRQNANGIDLESNWSAEPGEPEVRVIRSRYENFMGSDLPIRIALNMHSSSRGVRYFVYHHENGTSPAYAEEERMFINLVQSHWPDGISGWNEFVSWKTGTPDYYPESWFWLNYGEAVMALTYEDIYGETSYGFDLAASAILNGIVDFLGLRSSALNAYDQHGTGAIRATAQVYPNPVSSSLAASNLRLSLTQSEFIQITIYDVLGREVKQFPLQRLSSGNHNIRFNPSQLPNGFYFFRIVGSATTITAPMIITK